MAIIVPPRATRQRPLPANPPVARRPRSDRPSRVPTVLIVILLVAVSLFILLPVIWMVSASFRTQGDLVGNPTSLIPQVFTLDNYINVWQRIPFGRQLLNTIIFAGGTTLASLLFDSMAAYALARFNFPGRDVVFILIVVTLMIPIQVTFIPLYELLADFGWINTFHGLVIPRVADAFGIFFLRQFFLSLPKDLEDAARIDGAGEVRIFARIMLPLAGPALLTVAMFTFLASWNDLLWPLLVATDPQMQTLPAGLALFKGQHSSDYGMLMAGAILALLPMIVAFVFVQRRFIEGIATTGMK
ncbi:carbohydrate ABC transporter permease [Cryobacterium lactosi]|uniref:Carbohydrate ABC transporter permease n=1 Tax=Cryobacterium lactosi TaxID=1259202 RepID=A0A4R9BUP1_9MICO|nr:carbohydrate ABC transporter permease [Cryobacterium lactosi]